jgi:peptide/nickel transport system substrate-binding protein
VRGSLRSLALLCVVALFAAACGEEPSGGPAQEPQQELQRGGTLLMGISADVDQAFDPAEEYSQISWQVFKCCLLRTLLSFDAGITADEGALEPLPDLAEDLPEVSEDGLTYTFTLREGITYAPPYQDTVITAQDFVRAIERLACDKCSDEGYPFYYSVIEGFDDSGGEPGSVTGVQALDDRTLEITLNQPAGDFAFLMTMPATAPIPEGAAEGHDEDYGRYLAASGPYMFEGSETLDPSLPPDEQPTVPGYDPGRSWSLVRNPSWDPETDPLRPAYLDGMQWEINESSDVNYNKWQDGEIDLVYDGVPPKQILAQYPPDPNVPSGEQVIEGPDGTLHVAPQIALRYISMNMALPPFDDIHVRKAMNLVLDKDAMIRTRGGPLFGNPAGHIIPNSLLAGASVDGTPIEEYDPYATTNAQGDVEAAKAEMAQSAYDSDGDGVCDDPVCENLLLIADQEAPYPDQNAVIESSAEELGITFDVREGDRYTFMYDTCDDPASQFALCPSVGWFADYADANTFGLPLFHSDGIGSSNYSLLGADSQLLQESGYDVTEVPSADEMIEACQLEPIGDARAQCWADVDAAIMEEMVPIIPWIQDQDVRISGPRIVEYIADPAMGLIALDQVALVDGGAEA